jgi:Raf kinase inhibitor-like YbhB/YbcL family protein
VTLAHGSIRSIAVAVTALALSALVAGCDTGDGKDLQPFDPADYPAPTAPSTTIEFDEFNEFDVGDGVLDSGGLDSGGLDSGGLDSDGGSVAADAEPFTVIAPWPDGGVIDVAYTCDGEDISPAVSWGAVPAGTVEIALALVDDSALSDGQPFVHWVIGGLDPNEVALSDGDVPPGAVQALNFFGDVGYGGPCPPPGDAPHEYRLTAFALAQQLEVEDATPAEAFLDVVFATAFASAEVTGLFER